MPTKEQLRAIIRDRLTQIAEGINAALSGKKLSRLKAVLKRVGRGGILPHWFARLDEDGTLPNLDGKTIGSVIEMLLVAVLESSTFRGLGVPPLGVNPAKGVDLPDLDLGIKSPSKNYCTSEPISRPMSDCLAVNMTWSSCLPITRPQRRILLSDCRSLAGGI